MRRGWTTGLEHNGLRTLRLERGIQTSGGDHKAPCRAFAFELQLDVNAAVSVSRSRCDRIGHPRAAAAHGPFRFSRSIPCSLVFYFRVQLTPGENDVGGDVEPEQQDDDSAQRAVGFVVVAELRDIEREA